MKNGMSLKERTEQKRSAEIAQEVEVLAKMLGPTLAVWTTAFSFQDADRAGREIAGAVLDAGYRRPTPSPDEAPQ